MALTPSGDVLVSNPGAGTITLLRPSANNVPQAFTFASGLTKPHDMVFRQIGNIMYLYVAESNRITRSIYTSGDIQTAAREVIVDNLPNASLPELRGTYFHELKNIALGPDNKLYVSIASSCNDCYEDTVSNPIRGAIYQYNADGTGGRLFARGLRNAEGLDFLPGTNTLWVTVNSRDQIQYPFNNDFDGDGLPDLGNVLPTYVDYNPPDLFTQVRDGGNYGWPFCNPLPNDSMSNLLMVVDNEANANSTHLNCATADRPSKGILAHSAALGMSFLHNTNVPAAYRSGAVAALHGCWNCTQLRSGYKVVYFPFDANGNPGAEMDLVTGFVTDPNARVYWGRPVDVIADASGNLLISDDYAGAIYQLHPQ
jgi:glucose/arabinose dehydrogenase